MTEQIYIEFSRGFNVQVGKNSYFATRITKDKKHVVRKDIYQNYSHNVPEGVDVLVQIINPDFGGDEEI